jgi:hypothetical protein
VYVVAAMAFLKNLTRRASLVDLGVSERVGREWSNSALTLKARAEGCQPARRTEEEPRGLPRSSLGKQEERAFDVDPMISKSLLCDEGSHQLRRNDLN